MHGCKSYPKLRNVGYSGVQGGVTLPTFKSRNRLQISGTDTTTESCAFSMRGAFDFWITVTKAQTTRCLLTVLLTLLSNRLYAIWDLILCIFPHIPLVDPSHPPKHDLGPFKQSFKHRSATWQRKWDHATGSSVAIGRPDRCAFDAICHETRRALNNRIMTVWTVWSIADGWKHQLNSVNCWVNYYTLVNWPLRHFVAYYLFYNYTCLTAQIFRHGTWQHRQNTTPFLRQLWRRVVLWFSQLLRFWFTYLLTKVSQVILICGNLV